MMWSFVPICIRRIEFDYFFLLLPWSLLLFCFLFFLLFFNCKTLDAADFWFAFVEASTAPCVVARCCLTIRRVRVVPRLLLTDLVVTLSGCNTFACSLLLSSFTILSKTLGPPYELGWQIEKQSATLIAVLLFLFVGV